MDEKMKAAKLSILSNTLLVLAKLAVGLITHSVSIISEAIHSLLDLVAAVIAFFSVRESQKPPDELHRYGHGKIENVSGVIEALLIFIAAIWIIYEAVDKIMLGVEVQGIGWGLLVMGGAGIVNWVVSSKLFEVAKRTDSIALEADAMHLRTDVYTTAGVFLGLLLMYITGFSWLDPIIAIIVALMIIKAAWGLTKEALLPLLDISLPEKEEAVINGIINAHAQDFIEFHKLRTRKAGPERHIDLHLVVPKGKNIEEVNFLVNHIREDIERQFPATQVLMHVEPCKDECTDCNTETCRK